MKQNLADEAVRILIVDDEPHVCELLSRFLTQAGYDCTVAFSGEEAAQLLLLDHFEVVISDIMMPGMSGIDLLNIITRSYPDTVVLMVTAVDDRETGVIAVEAGACGYIIKPFTRNEILISVVSALKHRRERQADSRLRGKVGVPVAEQPPEPIPNADEILGCIRAGMDDAELMELLDVSSERLHEIFEQLAATGALNRQELAARSKLSPQTVVLDRHPAQPMGPQDFKPAIRAKDAVACIKAGMDDLALMKRYGISAKGLRSLYQKLIDVGYLTVEDLYQGAQSRVSSVLTDELRDFPRRYLAVTVPIYERIRPEAKSLLVDITERGIGIRGIEAQVGEVKSFVISMKSFSGVDDIYFEAFCLWVKKDAPEGQPLAGFQITNISEKSLTAFRQLIRMLTLAD